MASKPGALEKVLFLTRGVLCADLLTVDTLDGKTLQTHPPKTVSFLFFHMYSNGTRVNFEKK